MAEGNQNVTGQITRSAGTEASNVAGAITSMRVDEMISNLAIGIAHGQMELDQTCMEIAQFMADAQVAFGKKPGSDDPDLLSLIELGFSPNFYQFVDTIIEVRVSVSTQYEEKREVDTSEMDLHTDSAEAQASYESQSSRRDTGVRSSGSSSSWGWGWWGGRSSSHSYVNTGVSTASSSRAAGSSSMKSKNLRMTTVDAKFASTYNYSVEASSLVKTKIVPVPPPTVFEEIVRSKMQDRRDWEERQRLTDQTEALLPGLINSADAIRTDESLFSTEAGTGYKPENAVALQDNLLKLQESYGTLATDHWAIIGSVRDREITDSAMNGSIDKARQIVSNFDEEGNMAEIDAGYALSEGIKSDLQRFSDKLGEIKDALFPPELLPAG